MNITRIINTSKADGRGFQIVLAETDGHHKFVTWLRDPNNGYHYGDYCAELPAAMQSYIERCEENGISA